MDLEERRSQIVNRKSLWPSWAVVAVAFVGRAAVTFVGQKRKCTAAFVDRAVVTFVGQNPVTLARVRTGSVGTVTMGVRTAFIGAVTTRVRTAFVCIVTIEGSHNGYRSGVAQSRSYWPRLGSSPLSI